MKLIVCQYKLTYTDGTEESIVGTKYRVSHQEQTCLDAEVRIIIKH